MSKVVLLYAPRVGAEIRRPRIASVVAEHDVGMLAFPTGTWVRGAIRLDLRTEDGVLHLSVPGAAEAAGRDDCGEYWQERFDDAVMK